MTLDATLLQIVGKGAQALFRQIAGRAHAAEKSWQVVRSMWIFLTRGLVPFGGTIKFASRERERPEGLCLVQKRGSSSRFTLHAVFIKGMHEVVRRELADGGAGIVLGDLTKAGAEIDAGMAGSGAHPQQRARREDGVVEEPAASQTPGSRSGDCSRY